MSGEHPSTRVVLVRHGESVVTVNRVIGGPRTCSGLSELGVQQANRLRDRLAETGEIGATKLYSSAYPRAIETAEIIAPALGIEVEIDPDFGEHDPGPECDGMSFSAFVENYGMPDWETNPFGVTFPGGESIAEFHLRVGAAWARAVNADPGGTVVIICHGGVIDVIMRQVLRAPMTGAFDIHTLNTSLTELRHSRPDRWQLIRYNDTAHLFGLPRESPRMSDG